MTPGQRRGPGRGPARREKADDFGLAWKRLFQYMDRYRAPFIAALVIACVGTVLTLAGPNLISEITDLIEEGLTGVMDLEGIVSICLLLVCLYSVSAVLTFVQQYIMTTISQRTASNFRRDISRKINRLPLRYFDTNTTGDVMSRITNDVDTLGQSMNQSISTMATAITLLGGSVIMMLYTNVTMAVTAILSSLVGFVFMAVVMGRSQKYFERQQDDLGDMNGHVEEMYSGHLVMKAYGGEKAAKAEFDRINESLYKSGFMSQFLGGLMMPFMNFIGNFGYVMVCIVGAMLCIDGRISFGVIVAFMIYVRLFTQPLTQISQAMVSMQAVAAAAERVFEFLDEPEMEDESDKNVRLDRVEGHVEFRDVHFGYSADKEIIHGFSADILPGQKVAIVGPTGAGKTTMVNLLMRFYEISGGTISIDGIDTKSVPRWNVHDQFSMVLQDTWVFRGTVRENIAYSKPGVTDKQIEDACKAVGLHHYIMSLPNGYDTVLDDKATLSQGQKQLLTIARAMVEDAPILILDEATSSVDTRTEKKISEAFDKLMTGRTCFIVAHRLSTIRNADIILVMEKGNVVEQGNHEELMKQQGFYAELYNSQFEEN